MYCTVLYSIYCIYTHMIWVETRWSAICLSTFCQFACGDLGVRTTHISRQARMGHNGLGSVCARSGVGFATVRVAGFNWGPQWDLVNCRNGSGKLLIVKTIMLLCSKRRLQSLARRPWWRSEQAVVCAFLRLIDIDLTIVGTLATVFADRSCGLFGTSHESRHCRLRMLRFTHLQHHSAHTDSHQLVASRQR